MSAPSSRQQAMEGGHVGRRSAASRNGVAAALAGAAAAGYLLVSGALDPMLAQAVSMALGDDRATDAGSDAARVADWMYFDDRPEWSTLRENPAPPSAPAGPAEPARPAVAPPENPHRWQFSGPAPMPHYSLAPPDSCPGYRSPGHDQGRLTATPGTGSATVSWFDTGDQDTRSYDISVIPADAAKRPVRLPDGTSQAAPIRSITVPAPNTCKQVDVVVTGLVSGDSYRFWVTATNRAPEQGDRLYRVGRGQSETVTIL
jgi:hypothetical protein